MRISVRLFVSLIFGLLAGGVFAQPVPPPPPSYGTEPPRERVREPSPERFDRREERREQHEAWRRMSPEERHQLRRDIRDAGHMLYPRGPRRGDD